MNLSLKLLLLALFVAVIGVVLPISNDSVFQIEVNNTNLAPTVSGEINGTGERIQGVTYYANETPLELFVWGHAQNVSQTAELHLYINGTKVSDTSGRPIGIAEQSNKTINAIIPKYASYMIEATNTHHYEWREYKILSGQEGEVYINNYNTYNNSFNGTLVYGLSEINLTNGLEYFYNGAFIIEHSAGNPLGIATNLDMEGNDILNCANCVNQTQLDLYDYGCESTYCIYHPSSDITQTYAKNGSTQEIDFNGTNATFVINSAIELMTSGGKILFREGTYDANIIINQSYVSLVGEGMGTVIRANSGAIIYVDGSVGGDFITISNIYLNGRFLAEEGINVSQSARLRIDNIYLQSTNGTGIVFTGASAALSTHAAQLTNLRLIDIGGTGIWLKSYCYDTEMINVWIGSPGILNDNSNYVGIRDECGNSMYSNIHIWNSSWDGLQIRSESNKITNSYIESNKYSGINIYTGYRNNIITGTYFWDNGQRTSSTGWAANIYLQNAYNNVITGNIFISDKTNKVSTHLSMNGSSYNNTVVGNSFDNNTRTGTSWEGNTTGLIESSNRNW